MLLNCYIHKDGSVLESRIEYPKITIGLGPDYFKVKFCKVLVVSKIILEANGSRRN